MTGVEFTLISRLQIRKFLAFRVPGSESFSSSLVEVNEGFATSGCLSQIQDPDFFHLGSQILDGPTTTKRRKKLNKKVVLPFFVG
jgi:hypothetical protein